MEQAAKDQLLAVSRLPGVVKAVGLPDLHPGRIPVGTAVLSRGVLYPHLLGNDIGCGMSLFDTGVKKRSLNRRNGYQGWRPSGSWRISVSNPYEEECPIRDLGTLGGGNHFAEFQCVERIYDQEAAREPGALCGPYSAFWSTGDPGDTARRSCHGFGCRRGLRMVLNRQRPIWLSMTEL